MDIFLSTAEWRTGDLGRLHNSKALKSVFGKDIWESRFLRFKIFQKNNEETFWIPELFSFNVLSASIENLFHIFSAVYNLNHVVGQKMFIWLFVVKSFYALIPTWFSIVINNVCIFLWFVILYNMSIHYLLLCTVLCTVLCVAYAIWNEWKTA